MHVQRIYLWSLPNPVILVPAETNIIYCNQVNGIATEHRECEAFLIPLPWINSDIFQPIWWEQNCNRRHPNDTKEWWTSVFEKMEKVLNHLPFSGENPTNIQVIATDSNVEAWVQVQFQFPHDAGTNTSHFHQWKGILTWQNSD